MKKLFTTILILLAVITLQATGWRVGEQQIKIHIDNPVQIGSIVQAKINYEPVGPNEVRAWVVPKELDYIESLGLTYEIEIANLNKYYKDFWNLKDAYHSYQDIINLADSLEEAYPAICKRYVFGMDASGQYELTALKISDNVQVDEPEAEVIFDGGIHGDEIGGPENVIRFARDLCTDYGTNATITDLIDNREIWLYLMVNPWGRVNMNRENANGVDLNRDWCYMWDAWGGSPGPMSQPESKALRECMYNNQFVIHTTYHSGTQYVSFPWSYRPESPPDYAHINQLAGLYSSMSGYSNLPYASGYNGMYAINGSTKDSNYGLMGSISWSIEISNSKQPPTSQIMMYYNYNYPSMLMLIEYAGYGLQGTVTDATTGEPVQAIVWVNNYMPCYTDPEVGDYHKYVLPGTYSITITANGYQSQTIDNIAVTSNSSSTTDFQLQPEEGHFAYRFTGSQIPGNNYADEGWTPGALGAPDDINYSIGKSGWCILDMQTPILDGNGNDLTVYEGDSSPEGYTCFAGTTLDGPWVNIGTGNGTTDFDLTGSGLSQAQYIKILDDGDGTANSANAGFDLDAVEAITHDPEIYLILLDYEIDDSNGNNNGMIDPGETVDVLVTVQNNGSLTAENIDGTFSTLSPFITIDNTAANFGTLAAGESAQTTFEVTASDNTPPGAVAAVDLDVSASGGSYINNYIINLSIGQVIEDWETGNFEKFDWETGGNAQWTITTQNPFAGNYSAKSGAINNQQSTYLSISYNVLSAGEISFYRKVSSEASYDFLFFYIDDVVQDQWSGEVPWGQVSYDVTPGMHTFKWTYSKDQSVSNGSDCGWIDDIYLPSGAIAGLYAGFICDNNQICENETVSYTDASVGNINSWDWVFEGGTPATSTAQNPTVAYFTAGTFDVALTVSDGTNSQTFVAQDYIEVTAAPEAPETPDGPTSVISSTGSTSDYTTTGSTGADSYAWAIDPPEAGELVQNGLSCTVNWTDFWTGTAQLKVKAINDCGESDFSDPLDIYLIIDRIRENNEGETTLYPNPVHNEVTVLTSKEIKGNVNIRINNKLGRVIAEFKNLEPEGKRIPLNFGKIKPGIYTIVIYSNSLYLPLKMIVE